MFKVNYKNTRTRSFCEHISHISIADFEHVIVIWELTSISEINFGNLLSPARHCKTPLSTFPAGIYLIKVNNGNTRTMCEICSKKTIKTPGWRFQVPLLLILSISGWDLLKPIAMISVWLELHSLTHFMPLVSWFRQTWLIISPWFYQKLWQISDFYLA